MKAAYIISAYKRPELLFRLVAALDEAPIAIHIDRKSDIYPACVEALGQCPNVTFLPRHTCYWGLFNHVRASLEGMRWFLKTDCDYAILLTAQCYPLKTVAAIDEELAKLDGKSVIEHHRFPNQVWMTHEAGGYRRTENIIFHFRRLREVRLWKRQVPLKLHPYGGSGYWCLSRQCCEYVLAYLRRHPQLKWYFATTRIPDEMFFQTILANSSLKEQLINDQIHFVDWSQGGPHPVILDASWVSRLQASGKWFARKFDDLQSLDAIDLARNK